MTWRMNFSNVQVPDMCRDVRHVVHLHRKFLQPTASVDGDVGVESDASNRACTFLTDFCG